MKARRLFDIDILQLSYGSHEYEYAIDSSFFEGFEDSLIEKGDLTVKVILDKSETLLQADFVINGYVELTCDRSLENFDFPVKVTNHMIFKYGSEFSELTDEIVTIPRDLPTLNVAQYIYEFIGLAIPIKKLHPRFVAEDDTEDSEGILIYSTKKEGDEEEDHNENDETKDPRWDILNNLKKNLN